MTHLDPDRDEHAAWYDHIVDDLEPELSKATQAMLDAVDAGPDTKLLDLACGPGHTTAAATALGACALGIDSSPVMIEAARRRFPGAAFEVRDMLEPPAGPWDAIVCRMGVHHTGPAWAAAAIDVLRPGGRIAIAELDDHGEHDHDNGMRRPEHWAGILADAGFVDVTLTTRTLRLGMLAARLPSCGHGDAHFRDGPIHILAASKPLAKAEVGQGPEHRSV